MAHIYYYDVSLVDSSDGVVFADSLSQQPVQHTPSVVSLLLHYIIMMS